MEYKDFIRRVKENAGLDTDDQAEQAVKVSLGVLGRRLSRAEREHLATQLPGELKRYLHEIEGTERFSLEEYYNLVAARDNTTYPHAVKRARVVMQVARQAVESGEISDILDELPVEFQSLFGEEPRSAVSPSAMTSKEEKRLEEQELRHWDAQGRGSRGKPRQTM